MKNSYHLWLKHGKLRTYIKHCGRYVNIDGGGYSIYKYHELIREHMNMKVGDMIYVIYTNKYEPIKEIRREWNTLWKTRKTKWLEITFVTISGYIIYDVNDRDYATVDCSEI
jgi:hypothetical protein